MRILAFAFLALWTSGSAAQESSVSALAAAALENQAFEYFYSLEYDRAIDIFKQLRDSNPNDPAFYNHLASSYFYKQLLIAGALDGSLFLASNKFFRKKKIESQPALARSFWEANGAAIRLCQQRLKEDSRDEKALYACGVAYAARSLYQGLVQRAKLETLSSARKANNYHERLLRLNPRCYDAYLVPGIFHYALGSLPASLKFLLLFTGLSGDKQSGLQAVESTARWGNRSREDARIMLAVLYRREKRFGDAKRVLTDLAQAFPRNYIFPLEVASVSRSAGDDEVAARVYEQMLDDVRRNRPGYADAPLARIHYELGELYWKAGDPASAKTHLDQVPDSPGGNLELQKQNNTIRRQVEEALRQKQPEASAEPAGVTR